MAIRCDLTQLIAEERVIEFTLKGQQYEIQVGGITVGDIGALAARFPELFTLLSGDEGRIDPKAVAALGRPIVCAVIAAGQGMCGDPNAERGAAALPAAAQTRAIQAILEISFPQGVPDFVEALVDAMNAIAPKQDEPAGAAS